MSNIRDFLYNDEWEINDLLREAHPFGSSETISEPSGEGVVEDLIENQLRTLEVVYKNPTLQLLASLASNLDEQGEISLANSVDQVFKKFARLEVFAANEPLTETEVRQLNFLLSQKVDSFYNRYFRPFRRTLLKDRRLERGDRSDADRRLDQTANQLIRTRDTLAEGNLSLAEIAQTVGNIIMARTERGNWFQRLFEGMDLNIPGDILDRAVPDDQNYSVVFQAWSNLADEIYNLLNDLRIGETDIVRESLRTGADQPEKAKVLQEDGREERKPGSGQRAVSRSDVVYVQKKLLESGRSVGTRTGRPDGQWGPASNRALLNYSFDPQEKDDSKKAALLKSYVIEGNPRATLANMDTIANIFQGKYQGASGKLKERKELTRVSFVSPITGQEIKNFPITWIFKEVDAGNPKKMAYAAYLYLAYLKQYGAIPEGWSRKEAAAMLPKVNNVIADVLDEEGYPRLKAYLAALNKYFLTLEYLEKQKEEQAAKGGKHIMEFLTGVLPAGHMFHKLPRWSGGPTQNTSPASEQRLVDYTAQQGWTNAQGYLTASEALLRTKLPAIADRIQGIYKALNKPTTSPTSPQSPNTKPQAPGGVASPFTPSNPVMSPAPGSKGPPTPLGIPPRRR